MFGCSSYERLNYDVVKVYDNFEIRRYKSHIVAETEVEGDFNNAGNKSWPYLFGYISGKNSQNAKIAMTVPVHQENAGEKIAMTTPVTQKKKANGKYNFSFVMPAKYTMETIPQPQSA